MATKAKKPAGKPTPSKPQDATAMLRADHKKVSALFAQYAVTRSAVKKKSLVAQICTELKVHTQIEEEIFYPEERGDVEDDMLDEAQVEHNSAKHMIVEIEKMKPGEELYDAKVKVLGEYIRHHVKEEEQPGGIFSQAKKGEEDLDEMGKRLQERKQELMAQIGGH